MREQDARVTAETSVVRVGSARSSAETEEAAVVSPDGDSAPSEAAVRVERHCGAEWDTVNLSRGREDATGSQ